MRRGVPASSVQVLRLPGGSTQDEARRIVATRAALVNNCHRLLGRALN